MGRIAMGSQEPKRRENPSTPAHGAAFSPIAPLPFAMSPRFPFDAVLFDLDGTLVATERFWPDAAREACLEAFPRLGLARAIPSAAVWMDMVGLPLDAAFERAFPDLEPTVRAALMQACVAREHQSLAERGAALLPGVAATLERLKSEGVRLGIASNCGRDYLELMLHRVGLARWIEEARCLASPGVRDKADMVQDLLETFGTRSAVMVGDRRGDRDAAWANGLPHAHIDRGYAADAERVDAEAVLEGMDELVPRLLQREAWLDRVLARAEPRAGAVLGITGRPLAGKGLFARDLARRIDWSGARAAVVSLDLFALDAAAGPMGYDFEALVREVLAPYRRGEMVTFQRAGRGQAVVPRGAILVLEGPFLAHPEVRSDIDHLVHLALSDELSVRRAVGRDGRTMGVAAVDLVRRTLLPQHAAFEAAHAPRNCADQVVIAENALG